MFFSGQGYAADLKSKGKDIADLVRDAGENGMILVDGTHTITKTIKMQKGQSLVGKNYLEGEKDAEIGGLAFKIKFSDGLKDEFEDPVLTPTGDGSIMNSVKIPVIAKIANILYTQSTQLHSALFLQ